MGRAYTRHGAVSFKIPSVDLTCFTYYKIFGKISSTSPPPLVVLHGGPGAGHEYLLVFADLWAHYGIPVIFYDQIGCATSTHLRHKAGDKGFWQEGLFISELNNLLDHLRLREGPGFHLLGHSWGAMMGITFAATRPRGLHRLVLANAVPSWAFSMSSLNFWKSPLRLAMRLVRFKAELTEKYDLPEYQAAMTVFHEKHLCRSDALPHPDLAFALKNLRDDDTVFRTMYDRSKLVDTGSLWRWDSILQCPRITARTLVYNGEFDLPHTPLLSMIIPCARRITYEDGGHMCHLEDSLRENVVTDVGDFLTEE